LEESVIVVQMELMDLDLQAAQLALVTVLDLLTTLVINRVVSVSAETVELLDVNAISANQASGPSLTAELASATDMLQFVTRRLALALNVAT